MVLNAAEWEWATEWAIDMDDTDREGWQYIVMAYIVMAHSVAVYSYGLRSYGRGVGRRHGRYRWRRMAVDR